MPVREDLIERMVKALAQAFARILGHRKRGDFPAALQEADLAVSGTGVDPRLVDASDPALLASVVDGPRLAAIGRVLAERAAVHADAGDAAAAAATRAKAAGLLVEAARKGALDRDARDCLRELLRAGAPVAARDAALARRAADGEP